MIKKLERTMSHPYFAPFSLAAIAILFFSRYLFIEEYFLPYQTGELLNQWRPYLEFFKYTYQNGEFPLWSQNLDCGFPLASFPHAGAFYLPYILFCFFEFKDAFCIFVLFQLICVLLLTYGLLRFFGHSRVSCWVGSSIWGFCGTSMCMVGYLHMLNTLTWLPGIYWLSFRLVRDKRIPDFIFLTLLSTLALSGGGLESLLYGWATLLAYLLFVERRSFSSLVLVFFALILSVLLCSAPFLLTMKYLHFSFRGDSSFNASLTIWSNIKYLFHPFFYGDKSSWTYLGFLFPAGFSAAICTHSNKRTFIFIVSLTFLVTLFILNLWPINYVFNSFPVLKYASIDMRYRALYGTLILALIVATEGFDLLIVRTNKKLLKVILMVFLVIISIQSFAIIIALTNSIEINIFIVSRIVLFLFVTGLLVIYIVKRERRETKSPFRPLFLLVILFLDIFILYYIKMPKAQPDFLKPHITKQFMTEKNSTNRMHLISPFSMEYHIWKFYRLDHGPGFIFSHIRNGIFHYQNIYNKITLDLPNPFDFNTIRPETHELLNFMGVEYIIANRVPIYSSSPMPIDIPFFKSSYSIKGEYTSEKPEITDGVLSMAPGSIWTSKLYLIKGDKLEITITPEHLTDQVSVTIAESPDKKGTASLRSMADHEDKRDVFFLQNDKEGYFFVSICISDQVSESIKLQGPVISNEDRPFVMNYNDKIQIYQNRNSFERVRLYTDFIVMNDEDSFNCIFSHDCFAPETRIILPPDSVTEIILSKKPAQDVKQGNVKIIANSDSELIVEIETSSPSYLSVANAFFPGWRAWVDGNEEKVLRSNYTFQAINIKSPGKHRINYKYIPFEFEIGIFASITTATLLLILITIIAIKKGTLYNAPFR
jgi:hypothetical protein